MQFAKEIKRILQGTLVALLCIGIGATYWAIVGSDTITRRDDNPRLIEDIMRIQRGNIYDRDDRLLAQTVTNGSTILREYPHPSTYSTLGYYSIRYGEGGVESAFNDALNGTTDINDLQTYFERKILNLAPVGSDIQLTLDLEIQDTLVSVIGDFRGAGVVMNAQTGNILALASLPTFNPNTLDADWDTLTTTEGNPFFNRALQGQYQPGGVMYTLWMAQALLTRTDVSQLIANATDRVALGNDTLIACVIDPDQTNLSLIQAYQYSCPVPFAVYSRTTTEHTYADLVNTFALDKQIRLANFPIPELVTPTSGTQPEIEIDANLEVLRNTLGQGAIRVTPLHIAGIMSAIANNGNAPIPNILLSTRLPSATDWITVRQSQPSLPMMTTTTARQLRGIMQANWQSLQSDTYPEDIIVGANIASSLAGDTSQIWLVGFVRTEQLGYIAFVVLLEDTQDVQPAITIGQALTRYLIEELTAE